MSTIKEYISHYDIDKKLKEQSHRKQLSHSQSQKSLPKSPTHYSSQLSAKPQAIKPQNKPKQLTKSINIEGELLSQSQSQLIPKISNTLHRALAAMKKEIRSGKFKIKTSTHKKLPQKSPIQIPRAFQVKSMFNKNIHNIKSFNTGTKYVNCTVRFHKTNLSMNFNSKMSYFKPISRSKSPLAQNRDIMNKLSPSENKKRHISKSPVLGRSFLYSHLKQSQSNKNINKNPSNTNLKNHIKKENQNKLTQKSTNHITPQFKVKQMVISENLSQNDNSKKLPLALNDTLPHPQSQAKPIKPTKFSQASKKIKTIKQFTHVGFDGEGDKEYNQDSSFIYFNFAGHNDYLYLSVCDGHGVVGHEVSSFIKTILPLELSTSLKSINILSNPTLTHGLIRKVFLSTNDRLVDNEDINSLFSGSTCVSVIFTPTQLISANLGDSRAVLGRCVEGEWESEDLTRDHKPTEKDEAERIMKNNGRIQPYMEDGEFIGPARVWLEEDDVPGLAMTRSFGDRVAATVGVVSDPEIREYKLRDEDKFVIIASDGIWEFIESRECVEMVKEFYLKNDMEGCWEFLYNESRKRWIKEEEVVDDITVILVFFE